MTFVTFVVMLAGLQAEPQLQPPEPPGPVTVPGGEPTLIISVTGHSHHAASLVDAQRAVADSGHDVLAPVVSR